jgi:hypothetical protein
MSRLLRIYGLGVLVAWLLAGCAGGYLLDTEVQTFSGLTALPPQPTYRFERLPSQQNPVQAQLEADADRALHSAGWRRDDANARYAVQISGQIQPVLSPYTVPYGGWGGVGVGLGRHRGFGLGFGMPFGRMESPWYQRDVSVIVRDLASSRVVYETRATNAGPWTDSAAVFPAMFEAAMQGFPAPPPGPRRVDIQMGGR